MSARIHYLDRLSDGLVRLAYNGDPALWSKAKTRGSTKRCALTDQEMPPGTEVYRPVGNQMYRMARIHAATLDEITARMDAVEANNPQEEPVAEPIINAVECIECGNIEEDASYEAAHPGDSPPECIECEADTTNWVRVEPCSKGEACDSDEHHYGIGKHVIEV